MEKTFNALVIAQYDFTDKKGVNVKTTKFIVSLGEYGTIEDCNVQGNDLDLLEEVQVTLYYDENKKKLKIKEIIK